MRILSSVSQSPGAVSSAKNGTAVSSDVGGVFATNLSCQINFTGASQTGSTAQLFKSNDGVNWASEGSTVSITGASGTIWLEKTLNTAVSWRIQYACTGGNFTPSEIWKLFA